MVIGCLQVAELCRLSIPDKPWMALVGLIPD
jgi:hypothetical protein